jgi:hypothetical protein
LTVYGCRLTGTYPGKKSKNSQIFPSVHSE